MSEPTNHGPGSDGKIKALAERYEIGLPLWHPDDEAMCQREPLSESRPGSVLPTAIEPGITFYEECGE